MKKLLVLASLLAAVAIAGCGSEEPASAPSKAPEAAPAQKVEQNEKVHSSNSNKNPYKDAKITGNGGELHKFRENK